MAVGHVLRGLMSDWICIGSMERISLDSVSSRSHSRRRAAARRRVSSDWGRESGLQGGLVRGHKAWVESDLVVLSCQWLIHWLLLLRWGWHVRNTSIAAISVLFLLFCHNGIDHLLSFKLFLPKALFRLFLLPGNDVTNGLDWCFRGPDNVFVAHRVCRGCIHRLRCAYCRWCRPCWCYRWRSDLSENVVIVRWSVPTIWLSPGACHTRLSLTLLILARWRSCLLQLWLRSIRITHSIGNSLHVLDIRLNIIVDSNVRSSGLASVLSCHGGSSLDRGRRCALFPCVSLFTLVHRLLIFAKLLAFDSITIVISLIEEASTIVALVMAKPKWILWILRVSTVLHVIILLRRSLIVRLRNDLSQLVQGTATAILSLLEFSDSLLCFSQLSLQISLSSFHFVLKLFDSLLVLFGLSLHFLVLGFDVLL